MFRLRHWPSRGRPAWLTAEVWIRERSYPLFLVILGAHSTPCLPVPASIETVRPAMFWKANLLSTSLLVVTVSAAIAIQRLLLVDYVRESSPALDKLQKAVRKPFVKAFSIGKPYYSKPEGLDPIECPIVNGSKINATWISEKRGGNFYVRVPVFKARELVSLTANRAAEDHVRQQAKRVPCFSIERLEFIKM